MSNYVSSVQCFCVTILTGGMAMVVIIKACFVAVFGSNPAVRRETTWKKRLAGEYLLLPHNFE